MLELEELLEDSGLEVDVLGAVDVVSEFTVVSEVAVLPCAQSRPRQLIVVPLVPLVFESEVAVLADELSLVDAEPELERESTSTSVLCVVELRDVELVLSVDLESESVRTLPAQPANASPEAAAMINKFRGSIACLLHLTANMPPTIRSQAKCPRGY